jgi:membrane protein insertase Oxa1/YidC/SpoIIIJ
MTAHTEMNLISSLFDFKLKHFITMKVLRGLYALFAVLIVIGGSVFFLVGIYSLTQGDGLTGFVTILAAPLGTILYLIFLRIGVEFYANIYRIGDNTQKMVDGNQG